MSKFKLFCYAGSAVVAIVITSCGEGSIGAGPRNNLDDSASPETDAGQLCPGDICVDASTPTPPDAPSAPVNPGGFPDSATTGLTEEMCPDWENRKTNTSGRTISSPTVIEYEDINGTLNIQSDDVVVRCSRIQSASPWSYYVVSNSTRDDLLLEDSFISPNGSPNTSSSPSGGTHQGQTLGLWGRGISVMRNHVVAGCDVVKITGGLVQSNFLDSSSWVLGQGYGKYCTKDSKSHFDSMQMGGQSHGPVWVVDTTIVGPNGQGGQAFHTGNYSTEQITLEGNLIGGGGYSLYTLRNSVGKARVTNNTFLRESTLYGPYYNASVTSNLEMKVGGVHSNVWDTPDPEHGGNMLVDDTYHSAIASAAEVGTQGLVPIPRWDINGFALERASCTQGSAACEIAISASASGNGTATLPPKTGSSPRWRYRCGLDASELWHDEQSCNGQGSCDITDACDFSNAGPGTYTVRIYSEPGPGAGVRPSDHDALSFRVN